MKILLESHQLFSKQKTGVGYYEKVLAEQLEKVLNENNHTLVHGLFSDSHPEIIANKETIVSKYSSKLIRKILAYRLPIKAENVWKQNVDIYIFPDYFLSPSRKKTAVTIHDLTFLEKPEYMADSRLAFIDFFYPGITTVLKRVVPSSISKADVVIAISETMRKKLIDTYHINPKKVIAQGIPPSSEFSPKKIKAPSSLEIPTENFIYYQATLEPRKNHLALLNAYELLPDSLQESTTLVIAGKIGWKCEKTLDKIKNLQNNGANIKYLDYASEEERLYLYQNAVFYIQPSHDEGFGMPLLEAMACETPVLCSDIEIFHEVCEDASVYFDKDSPVDIASKVERVLNDDKLRKKLVDKGKKRVNYYRSDLSGINKILLELGASISS